MASKQEKLLELRKKKTAKKQQSEAAKHSEMLKALNELGGLFEINAEKNSQALDKLLRELSKMDSFKQEVKAVRQAIKNIPQTESVRVTNLSDFINAIPKVDISEIREAVEKLTSAVEEQSVDSVSISNQKPEDFIPTRRVRMVQGRLVYDDDALKVNVVGGGGGTINYYSKEEANDVRFDPDETAPLYIGTHQTQDAPTTSTAWYISKFTRDGNGKATRIQRRKGSWDDRAIGW